jgi:hypothetical protein
VRSGGWAAEELKNQTADGERRADDLFADAVIDPQGRERFLANPLVDHTASGSAYLPASQFASWDQGIALVARQLAA